MPCTDKSRTGKNYRMWHQKEPDRVLHKSYDFPEKVFAMGTVDHILYTSDKWEVDGDYYNYTHSFDSHPILYSMNGGGKQHSTETLLGVRDLNGKVELTCLADVVELTYNGGNGKQRIVFDSYTPLMAATPDNKTLVIFKKGDPLFVRGSKMVVTARGIVN